MIKGSKKQMIVLHTGNSRFFDAAYFVLRSEWTDARANQPDMLSEANRILEESIARPAPHTHKKLPRWLAFLFGALLGALLCALCFVLL